MNNINDNRPSQCPALEYCDGEASTRGKYCDTETTKAMCYIKGRSLDVFFMSL